ncbi:UNVERIFIED_CONTAM: hypothetical protein FKN15_076019 [Acipenser sinensis]
MPTGIFSTWDYKVYKAEQVLHNKMKKNHCYPFTLEKPNGQGHLFYTLIINGYKIEEQQVCGFSENYEVLETLGKRMATRLNINYFDHIDISTRHLVTHWPKHQDTAEELKFTV